jgi:hypothetical protein
MKNLPFNGASQPSLYRITGAGNPKITTLIVASQFQLFLPSFFTFSETPFTIRLPYLCGNYALRYSRGFN